MKNMSKNLNSIVMCVCELLIGILLLISPVGFASVIIIISGVVMAVLGAIFILKYFRTDAAEAAASHLLVKGMIIFILGAFCIFKSKWFIATFPIITMVYGAVVLVAGLLKLQFSIDMIRMKDDKWFWTAISSAISIICGIIVLYNPFAATATLWIFTGITLIVEAVFDVVAIFMSNLVREKDNG